jgi:hypothetical protein
MELLLEPPPAFEGIAKAFAMAKQLPATHRLGLKVGLVADGALFATGHLDGMRQIRFFAEHVRALGWHEHLLGGDDDMHGCDILFSRPSAVQEEDDPSFIRRPAVELWPARSGHVEH